MLKLFWALLFALVASVTWQIVESAQTTPEKATAISALWLFLVVIIGGARELNKKERKGQ